MHYPFMEKSLYYFFINILFSFIVIAYPMVVP
jgi:hypothetical protein